MPVLVSDFKRRALKNSPRILKKFINPIDLETANPKKPPFKWKDIRSKSSPFEFAAFENQQDKEPYVIVQVSFLIRNAHGDILIIERDKKDYNKKHGYRMSEGISAFSSFSPKNNILNELNFWLGDYLLTEESKIKYKYNYKGILLNRVPTKLKIGRISHCPWYLMFVLELNLDNSITAFNLRSGDKLLPYSDFDLDKIKLAGDRAALKGIQHKSTFSDSSAKFIYRNENSDWLDKDLPLCNSEIIINSNSENHLEAIQLIAENQKNKNKLPDIRTYMLKYSCSLQVIGEIDRLIDELETRS